MPNKLKNLADRQILKLDSISLLITVALFLQVLSKSDEAEVAELVDLSADWQDFHIETGKVWKYNS